MRSAKAAVSNTTLRNIPSVDELLRSPIGEALIVASGEKHAAQLARRAIESLREEIGKGRSDGSKEIMLAAAQRQLNTIGQSEKISGTKRVINATGVIIHTNLGRALLSENALKAVTDASGYCALEYDLEAGKRGRRGARAEALLRELTGAEDALIVNNGAAAAFFVLMVFASGGEAVISRGELVEIGGDFRVPDVLSQSGGVLREVGTTNRTRLADYEKAIGEATRMILRVHPSNYKIVGFTATPTIKELSALAKKHGVLFYEDLGSGALIDLSEFGLVDEPIVSHSIAAGVDIVSFSGDKLLGGPQAGIIAGRREFIVKLRKHPLYRALRVDKVTNAALEATLESYQRGRAVDEVPVLKMLSASAADIKARSNEFVKRLKLEKGLHLELIDGLSVIGGGAAPDVHPATTLIAMRHDTLSTELLETGLRLGSPPVITRIENDRVLIDLRTVLEKDETALLNILRNIAFQFPGGTISTAQ
ncbi:MAG: L-seryl-tRNA(Sec) selenium transferase [Pyrinomonadaceae bacterium]